MAIKEVFIENLCEEYLSEQRKTILTLEYKFLDLKNRIGVLIYWFNFCKQFIWGNFHRKYAFKQKFLFVNLFLQILCINVN